MDIVHSSALSPFHKFYESRLKAQLSKFLLGVISHGLYLLNQFVDAGLEISPHIYPGVVVDSQDDR